MTGTVAAIGLGIAAGVVAVAVAWPRIARRREAWQLHARLAAANGLVQRESVWLWQLAQRAAADRPASVFVRPSLFEFGPGAPGAELAQAVHDKLFSN